MFKNLFILYLIDLFTPEFPVQKVDLSQSQSLDWPYFVKGTGINRLTSVKGDNTDLKTVTEWTACGFL